MFFLNKVIHEKQQGACCPACGQSHWIDLQWQLPLRYSPSSLIMVVADGASFSFLGLVAAGSVLGRETVEAFLLTGPGVLSALAATAASFLLAWWLVKMALISKYFSVNKRIHAVRCKCGKNYVIISDRGGPHEEAE